MKGIFSLSFILITFLLLSSLNATTYTLVKANEDWSNPAIWSPVGIPGPGDFVIIGNTVEISGSYEIAGFNLAHGTIKFIGEANPSLTVTDSSIWSSGTFNGGNGANGGTIVNNSLIFAEGSVVTLVEDTLHRFHLLYEGTYLTNRGTIKLQGTANLAVRGLSILKNEGIFDVMSDADFNGESFSGGTFLNTGTFRKSGGSDVTQFNTWWKFQNDGGTIDAQSGSIQFDCNGTFNGGNYSVSENASIEFNSLAQTFKGTHSGSPVGDIRLSGSTINIDSSGAVFDFQGTGFQWSRGTISGGGTLTIHQGSLLRLVTDPVNPKNQALHGGTTLLNLGTVKQESNNSLSIQSKSVVDNRSLFEVATDADFVGESFSGGTFLNTGTFRKSGGNDITLFNTWWNFQNEGGTIEAKSGSIRFQCNGTFNGGIYDASSNASVNFVSGTQTLKGTLHGAPEGLVRFNGSTIKIDSSGAMFDFQGSGLQWSFGVVNIYTTLTNAEGSLLRLFTDTLNAINQRNPSLGGGGTLLNLGTIRLESNDGNGLVGGGSALDNQSLFEITTDGDFPGTGAGTFFNNGILRKSGGSGTTLFGSRWAFNNESSGVIEANSGKIEFDNGFKNKTISENSVIKGNAAINVASITNNGIVSPGNSVGKLSYIGNYNPSSTGVLDIELGGLSLGSEYDNLEVTGNAKLNGTLKISLVDGFIPVKGDSFIVLTATSTITDSFMNINAQSGLYISVKKNSNDVTIFIDSVGTITSVDDNSKAEIVSSYNLSQNYPNPFNPSTNIQFSIPKSSYVNLEVFNAIGQRVAVIVSEQLNAGSYNYLWNATGLTSGIYFYQITAENFKLVKKMILMK